ncbi:RNA polymerase sigma factor [Kriegella aquimaris]|uniref:RNA polymerase sigma-70 factor, ECF subfamily n=1 Tax=Kriegella aquimaris TaxID=192904 RepID=A0A1G9NYB2_9FLAO|nr:RNA polymerase sigma-70 factor [Kriegella aquimaris]SDL91596.1 RNA polymerase sigma-70 factor, ECF subfamily [Kriegella aquimaris]
MKKDFSYQNVLINGLKKGDENAYAYLVEKYHHNLCVYANSLIRDDLIAEDIVQNVLVRTWEKRSKLKPDFSIKNYLYKSVHNEFVDQYRKSKAVMALEKKYIAALELVIDEKNESQLQKMMALVTEAIEDLPPKCRQIFLLSKKEGLTNIEIAEHLDISKKTIEAQLTKAFRFLRKRLGPRFEAIVFFVGKLEFEKEGFSKF